MERPVTLGLLKDVPVKWELERNWSVFAAQLEARGADVDVFVTPECYLDGYAVTEPDWSVERFAAVSLALDDARLDEVCGLARRLRTAVVLGFTQVLDGGFYNAALLISAAGERVGVYHKTHLQAHDHRFHRGTHLDAFDLEGVGRVGMVICADRRWPESMRALRLHGAEVCLMPTYGMWHDENEWWMRTRAFENQMFVAFTHPSVAFIAGPDGKLEAKLQSNATDVLVHTVDLARARDDGHLADRRPDLYGILADPDHSSAQAPFDAPRCDGSGPG